MNHRPLPPVGAGGGDGYTNWSSRDPEQALPSSEEVFNDDPIPRQYSVLRLMRQQRTRTTAGDPDIHQVVHIRVVFYANQLVLIREKSGHFRMIEDSFVMGRRAVDS
jgi:hypothetical protein